MKILQEWVDWTGWYGVKHKTGRCCMYSNKPELVFAQSINMHIWSYTGKAFLIPKDLIIAPDCEWSESLTIPQIVCPICTGSGGIEDFPCHKCKGKGEISKEEALDEKILNSF